MVILNRNAPGPEKLGQSDIEEHKTKSIQGCNIYIMTYVKEFLVAQQRTAG